MSTDPTISKSRVIVLCFDGTSNQYGAANTNVVKFYALLGKSCPLDQLVYYQPGIGTFFNPGVVSPALTWIAALMDEAVAWYLHAHVMGGYKFLMQNYRAGDKICIFGFSRGAYTARALAGFLFKIGLLPRDNEEQVPFAYKLYQRTDEEGLRVAAGYKETFCRPVTIDFLGVWDTVVSVGVIFGRDLPFTSANSAVRIFRQAFALDEHRARFQPNYYHRESPEDAARRGKDPSLPVHSEDESHHKKARPRFGFNRWGVSVQRHSSEQQHQIPVINHKTPSNLKPQSPPSGLSPQTLDSSDSVPPVLEVWFAGCHSDVGGSAVPDTVRYSLADISLRWMVKQVILSQCGIRFDPTALRKADIDVTTIVLAGPTQPAARNPEAEVGSSLQVEPASPGGDGSSEPMLPKGKGRNVEEQSWPREEDVLADIHDQMLVKPIWWLLEFLPMKFIWQDRNGVWKSRWGINLGRGRVIREPNPNFHETVRERMAVAELRYKPRAIWKQGTERYVD